MALPACLSACLCRQRLQKVLQLPKTHPLYYGCSAGYVTMFSMLCYSIQHSILQCSADYVAMFSSDTIINRLCMFDYWRQQSIIQKKTQRNVEYLNLVLFVITLKAGLFAPQNLKDSQKCIKGKKNHCFSIYFYF